MIRQLAIAGALALSITLAGPAQGATDQDPPIRTEWMPCAYDEGPSVNCVWDARHQGNGLGHSYFRKENGKFFLLPHHIAHSLLGPENRRDYVLCDWPVTSDPTTCIWEEEVWLNNVGDDFDIPSSIGRFLLYRDEVELH